MMHGFPQFSRVIHINHRRRLDLAQDIVAPCPTETPRSSTAQPFGRWMRRYGVVKELLRFHERRQPMESSSTIPSIEWNDTVSSCRVGFSIPTTTTRLVPTWETVGCLFSPSATCPSLVPGKSLTPVLA
jgi:hypothetical protein